jgi:threonine dehydrogenase-like Zn-dependent dehydrogenase
MKAAVFKGPGRGLVIEERPDPAAEAGEVVIRVRRAGICASDLHMTSGDGPQLATNSIIGHEFCGDVVAVGPGVTHMRPGDRVAPLPFIGCGHCAACYAGTPHRCPAARIDVVAGFAEYSRVGATDCVVLPPAVSDEDGALVEPLAVGLQAVRKAGMGVGSGVLVIGAGPIGLATAFWARRLGARTVVVAANSARRAAIATAVGVTRFVALRDAADPRRDIQDALGGPPDVVFEAAGVAGTIDQAIGHVKPAGTVVVLGLCSGLDSLTPGIAVWKEARLLFSMCYDRTDFQYTVDVLAGDHRPRAMITDTIGLDALPQRFERLRTATADCKVMVDPQGS